MTRFLFPLVACALIGPLHAVSPSEPLALRFTMVPAGLDAEAGTRTVRVVPGGTVVIRDLELGISIEGASVELLGAGDRPSLRLQVQYETSVTIMDEGPHLDLVEWKHHRSEWRDAERAANGAFGVPAFGAEERARFPEVTVVELRRAVAAAGGQRWAAVVADLAGLREYPAGVDISRIRIRLVDDSAAVPATLFTVEFVVPMGC